MRNQKRKSKPKANRRKKIIQIREEISKLEKRKMMKSTKQSKKASFGDEQI